MNTPQAFRTTGVLAIMAGGIISAFSARQPTTFAMWATAYLVLVGGLTQMFFGSVVEKLVVDASTHLARWVFGLFNAGNLLVISSTAMKYAANEWHLVVTAAGSTLIVVALALLGWLVRPSPQSRLKTSAYAVIFILAASIPIGMFLAAR